MGSGINRTYLLVVGMDELIDKVYEKRLLSSKKLWKELAYYMGLLLCGVKDSYLIDCCALKITVATEIIAKIVNAIKKRSNNELISKVRLVFVLLDQDIIVIRDDVLIKKLKLLRENDWTQHPFIVNIEGEEPNICNDEEIARITECLMIATKTINLDNLPGIININKNGCIVSTIGFVFVAGWLLSYPCIYYYNKHHEGEIEAATKTKLKEDSEIEVDGACSCDNSLSMQTLIKYYVTICISACTRSQIHCIEFTIPKKIYEHNISLQQLFEQVISEMTRSFKSNFEEISKKSNYILAISDVSLKTEEVLMPAVML